jgi:hypothetical protein
MQLNLPNNRSISIRSSFWTRIYDYISVSQESSPRLPNTGLGLHLFELPGFSIIGILDWVPQPRDQPSRRETSSRETYEKPTRVKPKELPRASTERVPRTPRAHARRARPPRRYALFCLARTPAHVGSLLPRVQT